MELEGSSPCSKAHQWTPMSQFNPVHPHHISQRLILTLPSHPHLALQTGVFPYGFFNQDTVYISCIPHACYKSCLSYPLVIYPNYITSQVQTSKLIHLLILHPHLSFLKLPYFYMWTLMQTILNRHERYAPQHILK
jgi:hypothetical protein